MNILYDNLLLTNRKNLLIMQVYTCILEEIAIQSTRKKILDATLMLIHKKGYKGTTTRAIADEAGVNEVTIFRHFKSKKGIVEEIFNNTSYAPSLTRAIREDVSGILEADLFMIAKLYQGFLKDNRDVIMLGLKEAANFPELEREVTNIPIQIKNELVGYFKMMKSENKLIETSLEAQALLFIWLNFSFFTNRFRNETAITELSEEEFLTNTISVFARGLTP